MSEIIIQTENLCKRYGSLLAVNNVNMVVEKGAITALVGKNGAGKTTLLRMLCGAAKPTSGNLKILPERERKANSLSAIIERPALYENLNAMENLRAQCMLLDIPCEEKFLQLTLDIAGLNPTKQRVKFFSLGMKQRLAIAMAFVGKPDLMLLDEPTNGLDPQGIFEIRRAFVELNKQFGTTIVISSHILSELAKFATEYYFLDRGSVVKHATAEEVNASGEDPEEFFLEAIGGGSLRW